MPGPCDQEKVRDQTAIFNQRLKLRTEEEEVPLGGPFAGGLDRVAPVALEQGLQFKPSRFQKRGQGRQVTEVVIKVSGKKARAFDLREKASTGILKQEVGPRLGTEVCVARGPAVGIDTMNPLVPEEMRNGLDPGGLVHVLGDESGEVSHRIRAEGKDSRVLANQGARAAGFDRVASQAVNTGGGGLNPSGGLQFLAEMIQPPDSEMAFLDEPGNTRLEDHAGLMSNPR